MIRLSCISLLLLNSCVLYSRLGSHKIEWTQDEIEFVGEFFIGTIDIDKVQLHETGWDSNDNRSYTIRNDVFMAEHLDYENNRESNRSRLVHEMFHVLQYQSFGSYAFESSGYEYNLFPERHLMEYGVEQQAQIIQDAFRMRELGFTQFLYCIDCAGLEQEEIASVFSNRYDDIKDYE